MIQKLFNLTLDTKRGVIESPIIVVSGDTGNVFHIRVQDNGTDLDLSGAAILVAFRGAGGSYTQDMETGGVTVDGAVVSFPLYKDSFSEGTNSCDIQIYTDSVLTTTAAFTFECRPATVGEDTIRGDASLPILLTLIQEMMDACDRYPSIEVEDIPNGHRILIYNYAEEAVTCDVMDGISGVYVGSGTMPDGYNVQIDPDGSAEPVDYGDLENKPTVNGVELDGDLTSADLGLADASDLDGKVDKETGKGLSTNDYTSAEKTKLAGLGKGYELIETVTLTEAVSELSRDKEPDNTAYDFRKLALQVSGRNVSSSATDTIYINGTANKNGSGRWARTSTAANAGTRFIADCSDGILNSLSLAYASNGVNTYYSYSGGDNVNGLPCSAITSFKIVCSGESLNSGATIKIYAVRN